LSISLCISPSALIFIPLSVHSIKLRGPQKEAGSAPGAAAWIDAEIEQLEAQIDAQERGEKKGGEVLEAEPAGCGSYVLQRVLCGKPTCCIGNSWNMDKHIKQHRALSLKLSVALVVVADLEGRGSWRACGARLRERQQAARGEGRARPRSGLDGMWINYSEDPSNNFQARVMALIIMS